MTTQTPPTAAPKCEETLPQVPDCMDCVHWCAAFCTRLPGYQDADPQRELTTDEACGPSGRFFKQKGTA